MATVAYWGIISSRFIVRHKLLTGFFDKIPGRKIINAHIHILMLVNI